mmetsp:Transcript_60032/g.147565  ORF Transcript_60032/g.147565 Transcript_60032/m.147565 type:complete len:208 (+) Transcript_60032:822-1445(+)
MSESGRLSCSTWTSITSDRSKCPTTLRPDATSHKRSPFPPLVAIRAGRHTSFCFCTTSLAPDESRSTASKYTISNCVTTTSTATHFFKRGKCRRSQRRMLRTSLANGAMKEYSDVFSISIWSWSSSNSNSPTSVSPNSFVSATLFSAKGGSSSSSSIARRFPTDFTGFPSLPAMIMPCASTGRSEYTSAASLICDCDVAVFSRLPSS